MDGTKFSLGVKKAHDWVVDQLSDLFRATHRVRTQQVVKIRGHHCGDIELSGIPDEYNRTSPVGSGPENRP